MSNENDPWGQPSNNKPEKKPESNQFGGPPDLDEVIQKYWKKLLNGKQKRSGGGKGPSSPGQMPILRIVPAFIIVLALIWGAAGFYVLDEQERAVVLRLGKYHSTLTPGLQWQPYYLDNVITVNVTSLRDKFFSNTMITEDENIVDIQLQVQYVVSDLKNFVLNVRLPENALSLATESALRHVAGTTSLDDIITTGRQLVGDKVRARTQASLDSYGAGIDVRKVNVSVAKAPDEVKAAFDDVIKAREDKVRLVNQATSYENGVVPVARGQAQRVLEDARGYKESVVARSKGDTERFSQLLSEYRKAPEVTKKRMYLNTMESVLGNTSKVIIDVKDSGSIMYLPLDQILRQSRLQSSNDQSSGKLLDPSGATQENRLPLDNNFSSRNSARQRR